MQPLLYRALGKAVIRRTRDGGLEVPEAGIWRLVAILVVVGGLAIAAETAVAIRDGTDAVIAADIPTQPGEPQ